jgi:hypothetical protein
MKTASTAEWSDVSPEHQRQLACIAARYVRWPHPDLVAQVAEANAAAAWQAECEQGLTDANINPALYVWPGSTCLFPGIRRFKNSVTPGSPEKPNGRCAPGALRLDSGTNTKAKQVWTKLVSGFNNLRNGYHLVHLFPHQGQEVSRILHDEHLEANTPPLLVADARRIGLPGLYTSAANMCFMPDGLTRPTDADSLLRQVLWQRALHLYGHDFLPPLLRPVAAALPLAPLPGLAWDAPFFGERKAATRWQLLDHSRQEWFRQELAAWHDARPTCS